MPRFTIVATLCAFSPFAHAQTAPASKPAAAEPKTAPATQPAPQPKPTLECLDFLLGTWSAKTSGGSADAHSTGTYTFRRDLANHVIQRTSSTDHCTGPQTFSCQHYDQLTIFSDPASPHGGGLYALYLDSEGHVIYYVVTLPDPQTVLLQSQSAPGAPHFRLLYRLEGSGPSAVLAGSFQGTAPGSESYHPYLEWSGPRQ